MTQSRMVRDQAARNHRSRRKEPRQLGPWSGTMHKRLAFRMVLLLVAALLEGFMFVFHVRDMENERVRRDLKGLSESLALMIGPREIRLLRGELRVSS